MSKLSLNIRSLSATDELSEITESSKTFSIREDDSNETMISVSDEQHQEKTDNLFQSNVAELEQNAIGTFSTNNIEVPLLQTNNKNPFESQMDLKQVVNSIKSQQPNKDLKDLNDTPEQEQFEKRESRYFSLRECFRKTFINDKPEEKLELNKYFRVTTNSITILSPQEPWPKDVLLFQHYEVEQILLPDNANCLAVQTFLKMCQLDYKVEARANADAMSPTGRIPFIKCGAFIVSELEGIVQFVGNKGISLTSDLDSENKADMRAYMTLVNNVLGSAELYLCWCDNETYNEVTKPRYGSVYPWPLNYIQTWNKRQEEIKRLKVIGWYQKTLEEVYNDVETCCQALTDRLDANQYFFGTKFTELDALVYAHIYTLLTTPLPGSLSITVREFPVLVKFCQRIDAEVFGRESSFPFVTYAKLRKGIVLHTVKTSRVAEFPAETEDQVEKDELRDSFVMV